MRQVCFTNKDFIEYVNENMVVLYGFNWSGRNLIIDGEKVDLTEAYTPYEPDEKIKYVVPFAQPLTAKKNSGDLKGKYYMKEIADEIMAAGIPSTEYGVLDADGNKLVDYETFQAALEANITPSIFIDYFKQANDQLKQKNETQITGSEWRKAYWNTVQSEYYFKEKEFEKALDMVITVLDGDGIDEKYKKQVMKIQKEYSSKIISYLDKISKQLDDKKKREKTLLFLRKVFTYFEDFEDVTEKVKEICKDNKVGKSELLGEEE